MSLTVAVCVIVTLYFVYWQLVIVKKVHVYVTFIQQYVNIIIVFCDEGDMSKKRDK